MVAKRQGGRLAERLTQEEIEERSALMRLYSSRIRGEGFYPAQFVPMAAVFISRGWIEARGEGYRLTMKGVRAWARMCAPLLDSNMKDRAQSNELLYLLGRPFVIVMLSAPSISILEMLIDAGGSLPVSDLEKSGRGVVNELTDGLKALMQAVYVISDGETVSLTEVGRAVAMERRVWVVKPSPLPQGRFAATRGEENYSNDEDDDMSEKVCAEEGCNKPRMIGGNGKALTRCEEHMKAYWRENAAKNADKRKARAAAKKAGKTGKKLAVRPFEGNPPHPPAPSPTRGEGEQEPVNVAMTAHEMALEAAAAQAAHIARMERPGVKVSDHLKRMEAEWEAEAITEIYAEIMLMLRQTNPAIEELVQIKLRERIVRSKLGL